MSIIETFRKSSVVPCADCGQLVDRALAFRSEGRFFCCLLHEVESEHVDRAAVAV